MTRTIGYIQGVRIDATIDIYGHETVYFLADADIDCDGSGGNPDNDPCFQPDTTLHAPDGKALNAYHVPFVVVPPIILRDTSGIVLGSECLLTNTRNNLQVMCVVGDVGPHKKIGEISPAAARVIGVNPNPRFGGEASHVIDYEIHVGKPAVINGVAYQLKAYR